MSTRNGLGLWMMGTRLIPWLCALFVTSSAVLHGAEAGAFEKRVLVFYYPWYGMPEVSGRWLHWTDVRAEKQDIGSSTHYPAGGAYDSNDPEVIARHMRQMAEAEVDGAIVSWWGRKSFESDRAMGKILAAAAKEKRVVTVYYETIARGESREEKAAEELAYLVKEYGDHSAWLKVGGRPVIFLYGRVLGQLRPWDRWKHVRSLVKKKTGVNPFLVGDSISAESADVFDGIHQYNPVGVFRDKSADEVRRLYRAMAINSESIGREAGKLACLTIIPGYDDTKIRKPGLACPRYEGRTYGYGWEAAVGTGLDWVLITSWNEWHEGSEIEPSVENGDRELKATRGWVGRFKSPTARVIPLSVRPGWKGFVKDWKAGAIGVMGGLRSVGPQIVTSGLPYRLVDLGGFVSGKVSVRDCPILFYTGGEAVRTRFAGGNTLEEALKRYWQDGGVVVWASGEPWPLHRDAEGGKAGWSGTVGLPVAQGFEQPPAEGMQFQFRGKLSAFGKKPFPTGGDLRFRPCMGPAADTVRFTPLATLAFPDGKPYGHGIAAIEYTSGPFAPARMVYVWMRMWDVVDRQRLLREILNLAAAMQAKSARDASR